MSKVVKSSLVLASCVALFLPISFHLALYAQSTSKPSKPASRSEIVAPKLTPEQERGLLLLKAAEGESAGLQPFEFSQVSADTWQGKNVATKEILACVMRFESPHLTIFSDDYYFKSEGIAPGAVETFAHIKRSEKARVLWVQFVDGTEWGDLNIGRSEVLQHRQPSRRLLSEMVNAYSRGGEKEFLGYLESNKGRDSFVQHVWRMHEQTGTQDTISHLRIRLASAAKHDKTLAGQ